MTLALVGAGNMGGALLGGWLAAGHEPTDIVVVEASEAGRARVEALGVRCVELAEASQADTIVLAVKPHQFDDILAALRPGPGAVVVSIAAGVTVAHLEDALPEGTVVVRVMPNTGALVGKAMSGIVPGTRATDEHVAAARGLLDAVGATIVTDEDHLDALTAVSGSGPAYLFHVAEAMIEGGVHQGLTRADATRLTTQTFLGAAALLAESGASATVLREQVTSPGGTTAAALRVLDERGVRAAFLAAIEACAQRSSDMVRGR